MRLGPAPRKKEKQVITEVQGNAPSAAPRRQDAAGNKVVDWRQQSPAAAGVRLGPAPRKKEKQVITEVQGNAPSAAPRRQDAAGNKVVDWRQQSRQLLA